MMMTTWKARKTKMIVTNLAMTKVCNIVSAFAYFFQIFVYIFCVNATVCLLFQRMMEK